ncbi:UvrB/UvrC motif-containing protein [Aquisalibacillus elongatus]|uniref:Protein arginine kinase activator n=1 Tax=Aquisalibacillus elongatus TaxID=485577 RepID=A0A3N5AXH4_9BACI|nr:UvrB/UvrC motif-containing protein [Aquisalibacillus elongatus]RPF49956.1 protein arginine kinase activator [Aquisalibacillus elongatus]
MNCQRCQEREATVHYTQVINGQKTEIHLCEQCAEQEGYMNFSNDNLSIHQLLTSMFPFDQNVNQKQSVQTTHRLTCDRCGTTYQEFRNRGKFGCSHCYLAFESYLNPIFRRVHSGNTKHVGKIPKRIGGNLHKQRELEQLQNNLQQLIHDEAFEEAAQVRDEIRQLKEDLNENKGGDA